MARLKKPMTLALDPELLERLDAWIARQEFPPTKTAVFEAALRMWLDAKESTIRKYWKAEHIARARKGKRNP